MLDFKELIKKKRPNIKELSIKNYIKNVKNLYKFINGNLEMEDLDFLNNTSDIKTKIDKLKLNTRKSYLSSIVVLLDSVKNDDDETLKFYRQLMMKDIELYNKELKEQKKSMAQDKNWTTIKNLQKVLNKYKSDLEPVFKKQPVDISNKEKDILRKWLVGSLYISDPDNPPMRANYSEMKIVNKKQYNDMTDDEINNNNILINMSRNKKMFSFGNYKTDKFYGVKMIPVGKKLNSIINIYLKLMNNPEYLVTNKNGEPMTNNGLSKFIINIFENSGLKITINLLRHIYITENVQQPKLLKKEDIASKMCHSVNTQELYIKK
jgi:hypothetical protein